MPAKKKAAKSHSVSERPKSKEFRPNAAYILLGVAIIVAIVVVVIGLSGETDTKVKEEIAAKVNGEGILVSDLEAQYAILPDQIKEQVDMDIILTQNIEKVLLLQEAGKMGLVVPDDDVQAHIDQIFGQAGFDEAAIEEQLGYRGLTMGDIREMYREHLLMLKLIEIDVTPFIQVSDDEINEFYQMNKESLGTLEESRDQIISLLKSAKQPQALEEYVGTLKEGSEIVIYKTFTKEATPSVPASSDILTFTDSGKEICREDGKPTVYLFSTTWCPHCTWIAETYDKVVREYALEGRIDAYHYELDTGDDTLTPETETSVPEAALAVYKEFNPRGSIPTFVFGCRYYRVGNGFEQQKDLASEEAEFRAVIEALA